MRNSVLNALNVFFFVKTVKAIGKTCSQNASIRIFNAYYHYGFFFSSDVLTNFKSFLPFSLARINGIMFVIRNKSI